jgi:predicted small lipoprotein YifL
VLAAVAALVALPLTACGRYGPLEPPPDASAQAKPAPTAAAPSGSSMAALTKPAIPPITPPNQPFFLDPLLK